MRVERGAERKAGDVHAGKVGWDLRAFPSFPRALHCLDSVSHNTIPDLGDSNEVASMQAAPKSGWILNTCLSSVRLL